MPEIGAPEAPRQADLRWRSELRWRKSAHSNPSGNCVEVAELEPGRIAVRNSRFADGPVLVYTREEIAAFLEGVKEGDFDDLIC
ncbi:DUF397 domain-containing protein [Saccharopolyspora rhizosphaerae]|uniref:DUF397 domain-containing protein n=1 Tax=Saccharopolyspora rhizosphaerae TaxID=2492662 RepID=A0A3R8P1K1_9PSEU|nr:DUF397 domain-containing protein [Saccharopolyspora rhizosphaerae]RRO18003.1 DUF397 domain-containing protein [Saccharopolyspora rhizosphaerae]